jgi:hypothetical protein
VGVRLTLDTTAVAKAEGAKEMADKAMMGKRYFLIIELIPLRFFER